MMQEASSSISPPLFSMVSARTRSKAWKSPSRLEHPPASDRPVEHVVGVAGNIDSGSSSHGSNLSAFAPLVNVNGLRHRSGAGFPPGRRYDAGLSGVALSLWAITPWATGVVVAGRGMASTQERGMKATVYLETTIPSYLSAWPSRDIVRAAEQEVTREWWKARDRFELFVSAIVLDEVAAGDPAAAAQRIEALAGIQLLAMSQEAEALGALLLRQAALPPLAAIDSLHIALAAVHGMNYLLTWNCKHIANATMRGKIEEVCRAAGVEPPLICTPMELLEE
jgi:hypothetical protein